MLLELALLAAQTGDLPATTVEAARICTAIELRSMGPKPTLADFSRAMHLNLIAARETRGNGRMFDNLPVEQALITPRVTAQTDDLALRANCRARFPQAWATRATLPTDPFDRALLCMAATVTIGSLAREMGDAEVSERWTAMAKRLAARLGNDETRKRGIVSTEQMRDHGDALLRTALDTGGPLAIAETCAIAEPG